MIRELLAAGILRDMRFRCMDDFECYLYGLDHRGVVYKVIETVERPDQTVLVRILQQYNSSDLIQL